MTTTLQSILSVLPEHFDNLLDVWCGDGELISLIAEKSKAHFTGVSNDSASIDNARNRCIPNTEFFIGDYMSLYFDEDSFDVVVCPLPISFFTDIRRVLSPEGMFIMKASPASDSETQMLRDSGFKDVVLQDGLLIAKKDNSWAGNPRKLKY